ncbi:hypothetical protein SLH49_10120 [Cognatiyoonia sp. IB215446]|uniref:hypothetical protein n=1 Tax=Cognatiyoonia sp. IB215446 TaxID=3097355 RepID=UPI002A1184A1|nr:hypothetical protein [Cognatiyoonia sp. IB215446]MDX8348342.1 hypothetical protein [Cognatiyoonia sp. IB215446]
MPLRNEKLVKVDFTVIHPHPELPLIDLETVVVSRYVPASCFLPELADKRQIVSCRITEAQDLLAAARKMAAFADNWVLDRLLYAKAMQKLGKSRRQKVPRKRSVG